MFKLLVCLVIFLIGFSAAVTIFHLGLGIFAYAVGAEKSLKKAIKKSFSRF